MGYTALSTLSVKKNDIKRSKNKLVLQGTDIHGNQDPWTLEYKSEGKAKLMKYFLKYIQSDSERCRAFKSNALIMCLHNENIRVIQNLLVNDVSKCIHLECHSSRLFDGWTWIPFCNSRKWSLKKDNNGQITKKGEKKSQLVAQYQHFLNAAQYLSRRAEDKEGRELVTD